MRESVDSTVIEMAARPSKLLISEDMHNANLVENRDGKIAHEG